MKNNWLNWLKKLYSNEDYLNNLDLIRDKILNNAKLKPNDILLDVGTGMGLLAFGAYDILKENGKVIASDYSKECLEECYNLAIKNNINKNFETMQLDITDINLPGNCVDVVVGRSVVYNVFDKQKAFNEFYRILNPDGRISFFEPIFKEQTKITDILASSNITNYDKFKEIEHKTLEDPEYPQINFDEIELVQFIKNAGFLNIKLEIREDKYPYKLTKELINNFYFGNTPPSILKIEKRFSKYADKQEIDNFLNEAAKSLVNKEVIISSKMVYISANK